MLVLRRTKTFRNNNSSYYAVTLSLHKLYVNFIPIKLKNDNGMY